MLNPVEDIVKHTVKYFLIFIFAIPSFADEGMWTFSQLPREILKQKYQFEPTQEWADHLRMSSVRFNVGGSGSFVSANGLVITNHHVASDTLQKLSTPQKNYYENGFYAKELVEELPAPDLELNQLVSIQDVTAEVEAAVKPGMSDEEAAKARKATIAKIEKESFEKTGLRSDVITLYQGGQYHLYRYKKYTDVRLVYAPEFKIAFFGGDPDNFEYPRYDLDITFFRVYENGAPLKTEHFLKWSHEGAKDNELIFVSGNPGRTSRIFTTHALKFIRDASLPYLLNRLRRLEISLQQYTQLGSEQARQAKGDLFSVQNSRKVYLGRIRGLQDKQLVQTKQREEYNLRAQVENTPALKEFSGSWDWIAATLNQYNTFFVRYSLLEQGTAFNSRYFGIARTLVRMADEDLKPNEERLPEFRDSNRASLEQQLYSPAPIYNAYDRHKLADSLAFLVEHLGHDNALVKSILQGREPQARAAELIAGTSLKDVRVRRLLAKGGKSAISESYDSFIELAVLVDEASRAVRKLYDEKVDEPQKRAYAQIAKARFALFGTQLYPDATFTLRLAFGTVKGYPEESGFIPPMTTLGGAFQHEETHGGKDPYELPKSWKEAKDSLNLKTPFNFVSTADIIGGNSGSPVLNRQGEFVGIIFDGNIHSLISDYIYSDQKNRAVSVHSAGILEALKKIYRVDRLVAELD